MAKFEYMQRAFSSELKPRARLVLQVLVLHCNKEGECFPSIKTIAAKCGYGVSTVKRQFFQQISRCPAGKFPEYEKARMQDNRRYFALLCSKKTFEIIPAAGYNGITTCGVSA